MPSERTGYAPWSLTREAGVQSATVDGTIKVPQNIQPVLDTGFVDEKGDWKGVKSSEETFRIDATHEGVPNTARVIVPQAQPDFINMTGFSTLIIAIKPTQSGNHAIEARMGPDPNTYANLTPISASQTLRGCYNGIGSEHDLENLFQETAESLTADVWNIFIIQGRLEGQKNLAFSIDNDTGSTENLDFAYMRLV